MDEKLSTAADSSGRKNGFYKNISTIDIDFDNQLEKQSKNPHKGLKQNPFCRNLDSYEVFHLSKDLTVQSSFRNTPPSIVDVSQELKDLKQVLLKLQKKFKSTEKELETKSEKIRTLEKISEKNVKKINKIEDILGKHQEKIIKFEGIFKEIEYKRLSEIKEQELIRPCLTERKIIARHTYKDYKVSSVVSSPRVKNRETIGKLKSLIRK